MATEYNITGLTKTKIMDIEMAETLKRKKHRRGKKNRLRRKSPGNTDVFSTFAFDKNLYMKQGRRNKKLIRPTSPKAPMNSTQFLIEDRGHDMLDLDHVSPSSSHSPAFQRLSSDLEDFTGVSFYDSGSDRKQTNRHEDYEYKPLNFDDTVDFIEQEFEKDFISHQNKLTETFKEVNYCNRELSRLPKYTIIQKMFELEAKLKFLEDRRREDIQNDLKMKTELLQRENSELKSENFVLRNLLS